MHKFERFLGEVAVLSHVVQVEADEGAIFSEAEGESAVVSLFIVGVRLLEGEQVAFIPSLSQILRGLVAVVISRCIVGDQPLVIPFQAVGEFVTPPVLFLLIVG